MQMKKNIRILAVLTVTTFMLSCSDWLTLTPEDGVIREEFWQTKEHVNSAVIGCYASLLNGPVEKMFLWGELRTDMIDNGVIVNGSYSQVIDGEISAENSVVNWSSLYSTINNCNTVLRFASDVREKDGTFTLSQLKAYEAEAITLRALMYFYLVRSFGDVPLVMEASVSDDQQYSVPKTSGAAILDTMINTLRVAVANAPLSYKSTAENKSRITAWSARALLADILLWQERYDECNQICDEIIGSNKFNLIPVDKTLIEMEDGGIVYDTVYEPNEGDAENLFFMTYVAGNSIESVFEIPFTTLKTNPFYNLLGPSVNKLRPKIDVVDGVIFPEPKYLSVSTATDVRGSGFSFRNSMVWKYVGSSRSGAARETSNYTSPWLVYKYSDVLLMKAEALTQMGLKTTGNDDRMMSYYRQAIAMLETVRDARNAVSTSEYEFNEADLDGKMLEKAILNERAREFAYEGKRWYDVLRHARRDNYAGSNLQYLINMAVYSASPQKQQSLIAKYRDPRHNSHYWPIYITELETNKELKQNEFYAQ